MANLLIEKVCIIKNFEEANFSDFKRLIVNFKINPQKYNCPQKTCTVNPFTVPKFAISQSEANSTVLIYYDIKSLT